MQSGPADVGTPTRPAGWPGGGAPQQTAVPMNARRPATTAQNAVAPGLASQPGAPATAGAATAMPLPKPNADDARSMQVELLDLDGARVIARVGTEVIQEGEVASYVNEILEANASRIPPQHLEKVRQKLMRDRLNHLVEIKLALVDAQRKVPSESYPKIVEALGDEFEAHEVRKKIKQLNLQSRGDLEAKFREHGTSLEREKQAFIEQQLAFGWISQQTKTKHEATHEDLLAYYLQHIEDYSYPAKARWEELRVRTPNFPNRAAARQALADMGDAVLRGANFADVARARSQGPTAAIGGQYDWTSQGSLASDLLDQAIFQLPVGRLSQILDDGRSPTMSIVRVIELTEAGRQAFTEVQSEIKEKLQVAHTEKDKQKLHEYVAKLRDQVPIWTIYDDEPQEPAKEDTAKAEPPASAAKSRTNTTMAPRNPSTDKKPAANPYLR
ncbi:MAG: peptidyl-prolyl cis-trans isomerase [Singulisphaera sp.]